MKKFMKTIVITTTMLLMTGNVYGKTTVELLETCLNSINCTTDSDCEIKETICIEAYAELVRGDSDESCYETTIEVVASDSEFSYE